MVTPAPDLDLLPADLRSLRGAAQLHPRRGAAAPLAARGARPGRAPRGVPRRLRVYQRQGRALALTDDGLRVAAFARETSERTEAFVAALRGDEAPRPVCLCAGGWVVRAPARRGPPRVDRRSAAPTAPTRDREGTLEAVRSGEAHLGVAPVEARRADLSRRGARGHPAGAGDACRAPAGRAPERASARPRRGTPRGPFARPAASAGARRGARREGRPRRGGRGQRLGAHVALRRAGRRSGRGQRVLPPTAGSRRSPDVRAACEDLDHLVRRRKGARRPEQEALRQALLAGCATWRCGDARRDRIRVAMSPSQ